MEKYIELNQVNWYKLAMTEGQFFMWLLAGNPIYTYNSVEIGIGGPCIVTPRTVTPEEIRLRCSQLVEEDRRNPCLAAIGQYFIKEHCPDNTYRLMYVGRSPEHLKALKWIRDLVYANKNNEKRTINKLKAQYADAQECLAKEGFVFINQIMVNTD